MEELNVDDEGGDQGGSLFVNKAPVYLLQIQQPDLGSHKKPAYQNMLTEQLGTQFGVLNFLSQLSIYLGTHLMFSQNLLDQFNVYHQVKLILSPNHYVSN